MLKKKNSFLLFSFALVLHICFYIYIFVSWYIGWKSEVPSGSEAEPVMLILHRFLNKNHNNATYYMASCFFFFFSFFLSLQKLSSLFSLLKHTKAPPCIARAPLQVSLLFFYFYFALLFCQVSFYQQISLSQKLVGFV